MRLGSRAAVYAFLLLGIAGCASTPQPAVVITKARSVQPAVDEAKKSFPEAKVRYLAGLPEGSHFFITTRLWDRAAQLRIG